MGSDTPPQRLRAEADSREQSGSELTGGGAGDQAARLGKGLEPGGNMRRCSHNIQGIVPHLAGHNQTGMNADADLKRLSEPNAELLHRVEYAQAGMKRAGRVVFVRGWVAKEHEQSVAQIFGNVPIKALNDLTTGRMICAEHIAPLFGIELLR